MEWVRKGRVLEVNHHFDWMVSHSQVPIALIGDDHVKVYFATRTKNGKSQIARVDLNLTHPEQILHLHARPVFALGQPGSFDDDGVMPGTLLQKGNEIWLYYTGWNQKVTTPYHNAIGLAISTDGGANFKRISAGPIIDRCITEPYIAVTPHVIAENGGYRMWYASGIEWLQVNDKYEPVYVIKTANSVDGIHWERDQSVCIKQHHRYEALCAPTLIKANSTYKMWFCYRDSRAYREGVGSYRIGYAESSDGAEWIRNDNAAGIDLAQTGWDSEMLCYPNVVSHADQLYLFYNGNQFGRSGFGCAMMNNGR